MRKVKVVPADHDVLVQGVWGERVLVEAVLPAKKAVLLLLGNGLVKIDLLSHDDAAHGAVGPCASGARQGQRDPDTEYPGTVELVGADIGSVQYVPPYLDRRRIGEHPSPVVISYAVFSLHKKRGQ